MPPPHRASLVSDRHLRSAQVGGAAALAALAQLAVDMPEGYFGSAEETTWIGFAFMALQVLWVTNELVSRRRAPRRADFVAVLMLAVDASFFIAPLASDPVVAGGVVLWQVTLLGRLVLPGVLPPRVKVGEVDEVGRWLAAWGAAARHLLVVSLVATTAVAGFRVGERIPAQAGCLLLAGATLAVVFPFVRALWRAGERLRLLPMALFAAGALGAGLALRPLLVLGLLGACQAAVLAELVVRMPTFRLLAELFFSRPPALVAGTFLLLIGAGTLALSFPAASAGDQAVGPVDALFTATSAACVTGLVVLDTGTAFSPFGQAVVLLLIQVGGLNIMVLSTFAAALFGHSLSLPGERALGEVLDLDPKRATYPLVRFIVLSTLALEGIGALVLGGAYLARGEGMGEALWLGFFHAVSAFCNAGFTLHPDSLVSLRESPLVLLTVAFLITAGGLGFTVLAAGWRRFFSGSRVARESTQVKLVLWASAVLVVLGTGWYAATEWQRSLAGLTPGTKLLNAFFQSVTLRTAGFNSVDFSALSDATVLMMVVFMFIGASPGSTGGGIKTTTTAVLLSSIPAIMRRQANVVVFGRALPLETVYRSAAIAMISILAGFLSLSLVLATQPLVFRDAFFEVASALGTVGLTLGATAQLDTLGKVVIVAVMFLGRIGPLSLALLLSRRVSARLRYPEARVMVG